MFQPRVLSKADNPYEFIGFLNMMLRIPMHLYGFWAWCPESLWFCIAVSASKDPNTLSLKYLMPNQYVLMRQTKGKQTLWTNVPRSCLSGRTVRTSFGPLKIIKHPRVWSQRMENPRGLQTSTYRRTISKRTRRKNISPWKPWESNGNNRKTKESNETTIEKPWEHPGAGCGTCVLYQRPDCTTT